MIYREVEIVALELRPGMRQKGLDYAKGCSIENSRNDIIRFYKGL